MAMLLLAQNSGSINMILDGWMQYIVPRMPTVGLGGVDT
jgi:hypothetical protein